MKTRLSLANYEIVQFVVSKSKSFIVIYILVRLNISVKFKLITLL